MTMNFPTSLIFCMFALFCLTIVIASEDRACSPQDLTQARCRENEMCVSNTHQMYMGVCHCKEGYMRNRNNQSECVPKPIPTVPSPASTASTLSAEHAKMVHHSSVSAGAITAAVLVPLMLAIGGLVLVGRRYHWFERLHLLQGRHYEEVRIGQEDDEDDDPPLA